MSRFVIFIYAIVGLGAGITDHGIQTKRGLPGAWPYVYGVVSGALWPAHIGAFLARLEDQRPT